MKKRVEIAHTIYFMKSMNDSGEICSYIKGFTACYDQVEPMVQDVATISIMIKKQEEQLRELSASIMSTEQVKSAD